MAWSDPAFAEQYAAATTGAGLVRLAGWSTIEMGGKDRISFLHNMCTNDIRALKPGDQCEAFLTDVKGKILAHVIVMAMDEELVLLTVPGQAGKLIAHLERYIIREDVELGDSSSPISWRVVLGAHAAKAIASQEGGGAVQLSELRGGIQAECRQTWPGGYWVGAANCAEFHLGSAVVCDEPVWRAIRLESGWPLYGVDFDESNLPQEVNRDAKAISFRKGCYLGQETVARIDALGHVNKRLATVRLEGDEPAVGAELMARDQEAGRLTSVAWSPRFESWLGFAMLRRGVNEPGTKLTCGSQAVEVLSTPAVLPSYD